MDKRQQKTRKSIFDAFNRLLGSKRYDKITVQNILEEAYISRSTFYDHFESKDDLLKQMYKELFEHIFSLELQEEKSHDFSATHDDVQIFITHTLYHLRDNASHLKSILSCDGSELFWNYFKEQFSVLVSRYIISQGNYECLDVPKNIVINHITCTFIELIKIWIKDNMKESPETITHYFEALITC